MDSEAYQIQSKINSVTFFNHEYYQSAWSSLVRRPSSGHGWSARSGGWGTREREGLAKNIATFRSSSPQVTVVQFTSRRTGKSIYDHSKYQSITSKAFTAIVIRRCLAVSAFAANLAVCNRQKIRQLHR